MELGLVGGEARGALLSKGPVGRHDSLPEALIDLAMQIDVAAHVLVWVELARGQEGTALIG